VNRRLETLVISLEADLNLPEEQRETGASDVSLRSVIDQLQRAEQSEQGGQPELANQALDLVGYQISDTWSFRSVLGAEILAVVQAAKR
jgi:hypothetical protein